MFFYCYDILLIKMIVDLIIKEDSGNICGISLVILIKLWNFFLEQIKLFEEIKWYTYVVEVSN